MARQRSRSVGRRTGKGQGTSESQRKGTRKGPNQGRATADIGGQGTLFDFLAGSVRQVVEAVKDATKNARAKAARPSANRSAPAKPAAKRRSRKSKGQRIAEEAANLPAVPTDHAIPLLAHDPMAARRTAPRTGAAPRTCMQQRYDAMVHEQLVQHGVRVRKWRTAMSGIAWQIKYKDGRLVKLIESPKPKGPMSAAVFLHEIGHHAIGFNVYKPRCLEEHHAWEFSLRLMRQYDIEITDRVRQRVQRSMRYAVAKAKRRGLRDLPDELRQYVS